MPTCTGLTCVVTLGATAAAITTTFDLATSNVPITINFAGNAPGTIQIRDINGTVLRTCTSTCTVATAPNASVRVVASTAYTFGGITGACSSAAGGAPTCIFTPTPLPRRCSADLRASSSWWEHSAALPSQ